MRFPTQEDLVRTVEAAGVRDERVLRAYREVAREHFVPRDQAHRAYVDEPVPIPHGQVTSQPSLVGLMVQALCLEEADVVLEVGTGYGFQTALLARLARHVYSVERFDEFVDAARRGLVSEAITNVEIRVGDGSAGWPEHAPFDGIVVSAAFPEVPAPLVEQLGEGGRLVQPIGAGGSEAVKRFTKSCGELASEELVVAARFVKLYGTHGFDPSTEGRRWWRR